MRILRKLLLRLRSLFRRRTVERDLSEELEFHVQSQIEEFVAQGLDLQNARQAALRSLGGMEQILEECRDAREVNLVENLLQDVRFGLRTLRRSPGFTALALLCLTIGIGSNAAVLSWIEGILFRPYPLVRHQERLVAVGGTSRGEAEGTGLSWPDYLDLKRSCTLCETTFVSQITGTTLSIGDRAERTIGSIVSANYFEALGVRLVLGRGFLPGEDVGHATHPVVVISHRLWQSRFKGDPEVVGRTQRLNGVIHTIVGVAPEGFYGTFVGWGMNFWVPASMEDVFESGGYKLEDRGARWIEAYALLNPGVGLPQAQQEFAGISRRLEADYPATNRGRGIRAWPLWQTPFNNAGTLLPTLEMMLAVVLFVLLIAAANVSNLLLVRSFARRREMSVRLAIGASRGRLFGQLFAEGAVLSFFGAAGGVLVAYWSSRLLVLLFPARAGVQMHLPGELDFRVLAATTGVCLLATILLGALPALQAGKIDLAGALKVEASGIVGGRGKAWGRSGLVLLQVSLSFLLLVGAGLLVRSLLRVRSASPGFATRGVQSTTVDLASAGYDKGQAETFRRALLARVRSLPGVESASYARLIPLSTLSYSSSPIAVSGIEPPPEATPTVEYNEVEADYFATLGIPLLAGREFLNGDDERAALVCVVNEEMARRYWPGRSPIGDRVKVKDRWRLVVGVAMDSKYSSVRESPRPFLYVPVAQNLIASGMLLVRTPLSPEVMATAIAAQVHALDGSLAPYEVITMQEQLDRSTSPQMAAVTLAAVLSGLALLLASIGLYGVMSYAVSESTRELGLRMALGAGATSLLQLVLSRGLGLAGLGVLMGAALSLGFTRLLADLLYKVSPRDPLAFGAALAVMAAVSLAACLLPARRAMRTDPARVLRE